MRTWLPRIPLLLAAVSVVLVLLPAGPAVGQSISSISPATVPAFNPGKITLKGSWVLIREVEVLPGVTPTDPRFTETVLGRELQFSAPHPLTLGRKSVRIRQALGGWSSRAYLDYVPTSPPGLTVPSTASGGTPFEWKFGARPGETWILVISLYDTTTPLPVPGNPRMLLAFNILTLGRLDSVGLGSFKITTPKGPLIGLTLYSQVVMLGTGVTVTHVTATKFTS